MPQILALFASHGLKFATFAAIIAMLGTWDWKRMKAAENKGAESVRVETRKANDAAVKTSERVRAKSSSAGVRNGKRDPNSID